VEQARAFEARGPESLRAFVAWLERRAGTAILDYEGAGLDDDEDAVRVLTIHGAKGLEFPIVILAGLGAAEQPETPVFGIDRSSNKVAIAIGSKSHAGRFTIGPADRVLAQERRHAAAERDRLLYVGATRARDHLLVSLFHPDKVKNSLAGRLIDHGIRATCEALPLLPDTIAAYPPPFAELLLDEPPSLDEYQDEHERLLASYHLRYTSATALGRSGIEDVKDEREDITEPWARGRAGTHIGRAVHAALQSVAWTAGDAEVDAVARAQAVAEAVPERAGDNARLIRRALDSDAAARARAGRALREVPFALARDGIVLEGFMDLVIDTPDGLEIVDWKTDAIPSSEVERRLETYRLQAGLYVAGLEAATDRTVSRVTYVFVSAGAEASPGDPATLATSALARLSE
jgi:ATP-dependent helicase/nuclease subunit A